MPDRLLMAMVRLRLRLKVPRLRNVAVPFFGLLATLGVLAPAATADGDPDDYKPTGMLDLMPSPIKPKGQGTLYETYEPEVYKLDKQLSTSITGGDLIDGMGEWCAEALMGALRYIGRATVVIVQWTFNVTTLPQIEGPISKAIGGAAGPMTTMFLPSALAVGAFLAWAKRGQTSPMSQLAWVVASAAIATTFLTAPSTWVKGVDTTREIGSDVAMTTISGGLSGSNDSAMPFKTPEPKWSGDAKNDTLRRASDAVWRTYVATPWCIADLGSIKACQRWGPEVVKRGTDMDDREDYLSHHMKNKKQVGPEAEDWRQGHDPSGRVAVLLGAIISAVIFAALCITLAFTTLASLIGAMMLLICGVVFACLWCIPGKPRQWGVSWFETLLGLVLVSFTTTMILGSVMIVSTSMLSMLDPDMGFGWLMVSALNIAAAAMGFRVKGKLDGIISVGGAQLAGRGALSAFADRQRARKLRKALRGKKQRGEGFGDMDRHEPDSDDENESTSGGAGGSARSVAQAVQRAQRARNFPPPASIDAPGDFASTRPGLPPGQAPPGLPPAGGPGGGNGPHPEGGDSPRPSAGTGPAHDVTAARRAKAANARRRAGTPYPIRRGGMQPIGQAAVPPAENNGPGTVIQGTVVKSGESAGPHFRTFPPPPGTASATAPATAPAAPTAPTAAQTAARAAARAAVDTALTGTPLPGTAALPQLPPGTQDD
ncbi:hypothetical protein ACH4PU_31025 [Streptomyces sp. NPDC021100]|uniref:hypothetical protein n=1 Tax=Streptomyces sp. NPDC021100 TaxID=3365114 RepID=UPI0037A4C1C7